MTDTLTARIDRIESTLAIQQLPIRYAMAIDGRDIDAWIGLFIDDVDCGRHGRGREALRGFIVPTLRGFYRSLHLICGHRIDFIDADHATGAVYCRAEHEDGDDWVVMGICYSDIYERCEGTWYFVRREERHWYAAEERDRPRGPNFSNWPGRPIADPKLPGGFPTWDGFWDEAGAEAVARRTAHPVTPVRIPGEM